MQILGLDIGGANIKAATVDGETASLPFPMWQQHQLLPDALITLADQMESNPELIGLTMTAELADCFATKADGVQFVVNSVTQAFPKAQIRVWLTGSEFANPDDAIQLPELVAAANWHAQATWIARSIPEGSAVLLDIGSTTTDVIPMRDGWPVPEGLNDRDRLLSGELLYLGAHRTPLCAVINEVTLEQKTARVAAEFFATMADALLVAGFTSEQPNVVDTADNRPLTRDNSMTRIARMLCCDRTELTDSQIQSIAQQAVDSAARQVSNSLSAVVQKLTSENPSDDNRPPILVLSGSGVEAYDRILDLQQDSRFQSVMRLSQMYRRDISTSACAFAVARMVQDRCRLDLLEESLF